MRRGRLVRCGSDRVAGRGDRRCRSRRGHRRDGRLHAPDPARRRSRGDQAAAARPDPGPDDPRHHLRPADRRGLRPQAGVLLGRQSGRRIAAPVQGRGRARLAGPAGDRGAQPRGHGQQVRRRGIRAAVRDPARLPRHQPAQPDRRRRRDRLPVHRRAADRGLRAAAGRRRRSTPSGRTGWATSSTGGSPACRRRRARLGQVGGDRRGDRRRARPAAGRGRAAVLGGQLRRGRARRRAPVLRARLLGPGQRLLPGLGRDQQGPGQVRRLARRARLPRPAGPAGDADPVLAGDPGTMR